MFVGNNLIPSQWGLITINDIIGNQPLEPYSIWNTNVDLDHQRKIRGIIRLPEQETLVFTTKLGYTVVADPLQVIQGFKHFPKLMEAGELNCFNWLTLNIGFYPDVVNDLGLSFSLTRDLLFWLGYFYTNGVIDLERNKVGFVSKGKFDEYIIYLTEKIFAPKEKEIQNNFLFFEGREIIDFLLKSNVIRENLKPDYPLFLRGCDKNYLYIFLSGTLTASMNLELLKKNILKFTLNTINIAKVYQQVLLSLGIVTLLQPVQINKQLMLYNLYPIGIRSIALINKHIKFPTESGLYTILSPDVNSFLNITFIDSGIRGKAHQTAVSYLTKIIVNTYYGYNDMVFYNAIDGYIVDQIISKQYMKMDNYNLFIS
ncbi:MAG: hypothetical protein AB7E45_08110, partial [Candidatus Caldatribacteriota bacterium]